MSNLESKIQKKIMDHLEGHGFHVIRNMAASKAGEADVIAWEPPYGRGWAIEVKTEKGILSKLQEVKLRKVKETGGVAFAAFGYEDYLNKFDENRCKLARSNK
jgi:Holliday junction resolvase